MALEPPKFPVVRIIDIDGTIVKKRESKFYFEDVVPLEDAIEQVNEWYIAGDYICFWTARPECYRTRTLKQLDELGVNYNELLMNKPYSHEIHIYDDNNIIAHKVERDVGLGKLKGG